MFSKVLRTIATALTIAIPLSVATVAPAHADTTPVHGRIIVEIPADPTAAHIDAQPWLTDGFDAVGTVSGTIENFSIDPTACQFDARPGLPGTTAGAAFSTVSISGCGGGDVALQVAATADGLRGTVAYGGPETGSGPLAAPRVTIGVIVIGPIIIIIITF